MRSTLFRESDIIKIVAIMRQRTLYESELKKCRSGKNSRAGRVRIFVDDRPLAGEQTTIPATAVLPALEKFLEQRIAALTAQIRSWGVDGDLEDIIEDDGLRVVPLPPAAVNANRHN